MVQSFGLSDGDIQVRLDLPVWVIQDSNLKVRAGVSGPGGRDRMVKGSHSRHAGGELQHIGMPGFGPARIGLYGGGQ